jgi:hypothetical protein
VAVQIQARLFDPAARNFNLLFSLPNRLLESWFHA